MKCRMENYLSQYGAVSLEKLYMSIDLQKRPDLLLVDSNVQVIMLFSNPKLYVSRLLQVDAGCEDEVAEKLGGRNTPHCPQQSVITPQSQPKFSRSSRILANKARGTAIVTSICHGTSGGDTSVPRHNNFAHSY